MPQPIHGKKFPLCLSNRRLDGTLQDYSKLFKKRKNLPVPGIEPRFFGRPVLSLITTN
jgi:hypothetical protein